MNFSFQISLRITCTREVEHKLHSFMNLNTCLDTRGDAQRGRRSKRQACLVGYETGDYGQDVADGTIRS